jgi:phage terminase large subunit-like protein
VKKFDDKIVVLSSCRVAATPGLCIDGSGLRSSHQNEEKAMLEKLHSAAERRAADAVTRQIDRLVRTATPPGVTAEATDGGIVLSGKNLRRRILSDANLRNFGR